MLDLNDLKIGDTTPYRAAHYPDEILLHITKESDTAFSVRIGVSSRENMEMKKNQLQELIDQCSS